MERDLANKLHGLKIENACRLFFFSVYCLTLIHPREKVCIPLHCIAPPSALACECHTLVNEILGVGIYLHPSLRSSEVRWCLACARAS